MATKIVLAPGGGIHRPGLVPLALEAPIRVPTRLLTLSLLLLVPAVAGAQRLDWRTRVALYGDNTEFFTPYRVGETILGTQLQTWLEAKPGRRTELRLGFYADRRLGSEQFTDTLLPIVAFRYRTEHSHGVIGTLETVRRHGLLEPLMVTTRELTTPVESGIQWIETRGVFRGEAWVNWQQLNTPTQREAFEMGATLRVEPTDWATIEAQHLWSHRGGQLYDAGVPVSNNRVTALGATARHTLPTLGASSLAAWRFWSDGNIDPDYPANRPSKGHGTYLRASVTPRGWVEVFAIHWRGRDFVAAAGDNNYNSTGHDPAFYRSKRKYTELGLLRRTPIGGGVTFDAEARWHRIDDEESIAFFNTPWELSYRFIVRAPIDVRLRR
ncbi:MAG: hypothetical protein V9E87_02820 [Gemmatimonadales bacterium]